MKPSINPTVAQLEARIQLLKDQLQEWKVLARAEGEAHRMLHEQHPSARVRVGGVELLDAVLGSLSNVQAHLELSAHYSEERSRMRRRHRQQEAELEARIQGL